jgi:hypothetical protein
MRSIPQLKIVSLNVRGMNSSNFSALACQKRCTQTGGGKMRTLPQADNVLLNTCGLKSHIY